MSVVLSEHLPLLASAPDGIQKLRGLILELAVRGKLAPQDPNDEPASELLKRIAEKRPQHDVGTTRKINGATSLETGDSPIFVLAQGWDTAPLGEVVDIIRGITFPSSEKSKTPEDGRVRCLRTANVQNSIEWADILYIRSEFVSRDDQMLRPNDIVMSMANSRELVGKVALVDGQIHEPATFGGFLGVLRPHLILPRFVMAFLRAPTVRSSLIDSASQTTNIANISLAKLRPLGFPIPPLAEQHRIVAKVDELMALCDRLETEQTDAEAVHAKLVETLLGTLPQSTDAADLAANWQRLAEHFDTLFTTESSLDALKQTILQLAVMGKLVPQDPSDEPADVSLTNAFNLRKGLVKSGAIPKKALAKSPLLNERPITVPKNWAFASFDHLAAPVPNALKAGPFGSALKKDCYVPSGYKIYGQEQVIKQDAFYGDYYISEEKFEQLRSCEAKPGDLLISLVGTIGKVLVLPHEAEPGIINPRLIKMSLDMKLVFAEYVKIMLAAPWVREFLFSECHGSTMDVLNLTILRSLPIPLPPLAEQHRIVAKVDELMALCDLLKADLAESHTRQGRLSTTLIESALQAA